MKIRFCALGAALLFSASLVPVQALPSMSADAKPMATDMDAKKAKAKACSEQADAKKLHGEARKKFREECKKGM